MGMKAAWKCDALNCTRCKWNEKTLSYIYFTINPPNCPDPSAFPELGRGCQQLCRTPRWCSQASQPLRCQQLVPTSMTPTSDIGPPFRPLPPRTTPWSHGAGVAARAHWDSDLSSGCLFLSSVCSTCTPVSPVLQFIHCHNKHWLSAVLTMAAQTKNTCNSVDSMILPP